MYAFVLKDLHISISPEAGSLSFVQRSKNNRQSWTKAVKPHFIVCKGNPSTTELNKNAWIGRKVMNIWTELTETTQQCHWEQVSEKQREFQKQSFNWREVILCVA